MTVLAPGNAFPGAAFPQHFAGQTTSVQSYRYPGAVQPQSAEPAVTSYTNAFRGAAFPQHFAGQTTTVQAFLFPGAVQPKTVIVGAGSSVGSSTTAAVGASLADSAGSSVGSSTTAAVGDFFTSQVTTLADMAAMTVSGTPGVGPITLAVAAPGYQTFLAAGVHNGSTVSYRISDTGNSWEIGKGSYNGLVLTRQNIIASSNGNAAIGVTSNATVAIVLLAEDLIGGGGKSGISASVLSSIGGLTISSGSGAPSFTALQGSLYLRVDGNSINTRMYINTNGAAGWTAVVTES